VRGEVLAGPNELHPSPIGGLELLLFHLGRP
jgi:hypothetical protein